MGVGGREGRNQGTSCKAQSLAPGSFNFGSHISCWEQCRAQLRKLRHPGGSGQEEVLAPREVEGPGLMPSLSQVVPSSVKKARRGSFRGVHWIPSAIKGVRPKAPTHGRRRHWGVRMAEGGVMCQCPTLPAGRGHRAGASTEQLLRGQAPSPVSAGKPQDAHPATPRYRAQGRK